jgi:hypothetical protein
MFRRAFLTVAVVGAAVGVPYVASQWPQLKASVFGGGTAANSLQSATAYGALSAPQLPAVTPNGVPMGAGLNPQAYQSPMVDLPEAFRWDITPQWVLSRWPRVSSGLPGDNLQGMRVALISGMRMDDMAGSLTYYFNAQQKCGKITFSGTTGDPQRLITLLVDRYGFKPFASADPGVVEYQIRWNGEAHSKFTVRPAPIVRTSSPYERFLVQVSISDPAVK